MKTLTTLAFLLLAMTSFSQDKIYKKDNSVIECVISEIGLVGIKYYLALEVVGSSPIISKITFSFSIDRTFGIFI